MILLKYAPLLFLLCSLVVPSNSGQDQQVAVTGNDSANKNKVPSTATRNSRRRRRKQIARKKKEQESQNHQLSLSDKPIASEKKSEQELKQDKFSWSEEQIERIKNYIASHINKLHPDSTPRRISLEKLMTLESKTPNSKSMPHWPPSAHIGGVYWTEPLNFVSMEPFSTRIS